MDVSVIGAGHVGLVTGACFAEYGHNVIMVDNDKSKLERLKKGEVWFYEPGLEELVRRHHAKGRLSFTSSIKTALKKSQILFISVNTPPRADGGADLTYVEAVAREIGNNLTDYRLIVEKSTVPVQTGDWVKRALRQTVKGKVPFDVASNPEFLREGSAVDDTLHPDRIVFGVETKRAEKLLRDLYRPFEAPLIVTDVKSAELIKHASNSFLALKISFINAVAQICDIVGADVELVAEGMGMDARIGRQFLNAGIGYGGSCFPKDVSAFISIADKIGFDFKMLKSVEEINRSQRELFVQQIEKALWNLKDKTIGLLGLAFKPNTDDLREAPALDIIRRLQADGARVRAYDPEAMEAAKALLPDVTFCKDAYGVAEGADCLALVTEWDEFKELDFARIQKSMQHPILADGRNLYDPKRIESFGFQYIAVGRGIKIDP